ncbi:MAG: Long-chain acyl-CoA thioesterase FadM [Verrucomicrobiota bacterium]
MNDHEQPEPGLEPADPKLVYSKFESELTVRPDDIDLYQHVHSSRYMDYVLAARFDQMERCYGMPMAEFQKMGYGWVIASTQMNFRRALVMGDRMIVRCWIEKFSLIGLRLQFEIDRKGDGKRSCDGWFDYVMISLENGRPARIPEQIRRKYSI